MSHAELVEWMGYYPIDPFDNQRGDLRSAQQVAASLAPHSKKSVKPEDFLLFPEKAVDLPTVEDVAGREREWMKMLRMKE